MTQLHLLSYPLRHRSHQPIQLSAILRLRVRVRLLLLQEEGAATVVGIDSHRTR